MNYSGCPAWRTQWVLIAVTIILFLFLLVTLVIGGSAIEAQPISLYFVGIWLPFAVIAILYRHYSWRFTATQDTIETRHGIIARNVKSIRVKDLRNVNLNQSVFQRIFGVGDLEFSSAGGAGIEVIFHGVIRPMDLKQQIQRLQESHTT